MLTGGQGINKLNGGPSGSDTVVESGNLNFTLTNSSVTGASTGPGGITDSLVSMEHASLTGGSGDNALDASGFTIGRVTLSGGAGNDTLIGTKFSDTFTGGTGDDSLVGGAGNDKLIESFDAASIVLTNTTMTATPSLGTDSLASIEQVELDGGASANTFDASAFTLGPVTLSGGVGDDSLTGGTKNDILIGGAGNDTFTGGVGTDTVAESADVNFTLTNTTLDGGTATGTDTLNAIEKVQVTGGASNNSFTVTGEDAYAVSLIGGAGRDTVISVDDADFTLKDASLARSTGGSFTLSQIESAALTGGAGANTSPSAPGQGRPR